MDCAAPLEPDRPAGCSVRVRHGRQWETVLSGLCKSCYKKYAKDLPETKWDRAIFNHALLGLGLLGVLLVLLLGVIPGLLALGMTRRRRRR